MTKNMSSRKSCTPRFPKKSVDICKYYLEFKLIYRSFTLVLKNKSSGKSCTPGDKKICVHI
jgi:hypothetical protein